jgi:tRNA threonylcarbamoyladenosine biosynthesis protein TsaB
VRILAFETSTARGSVALWEGDRAVASACHEQPNAHAEALMPLMTRLLADAGWSKNSLDRLGVGLGPGSFTGLRVGIALADGLSLGLDRPLIGVPSLRAMVAGPLSEGRSPCAAVLDARRGELFVAIYDAAHELCPASVVPRAELASFLRQRQVRLVVGSSAEGASEDLDYPRGEDLDLPHARRVAELAAQADPSASSAQPIYVRGAGATLPNLPRSPLGPG